MSTFAQKFAKETKNNNKNYKDKDFSVEKFQSLCQQYDCTATATEIGVYTDWVMKHREFLLKNKNENVANGIQDFHEFKKRFPALGMSANIFDYEPKDMQKIHFKCNELRNSKLTVSQSAELSNYEGEYVMEHQGKDWWVIRSLTFNAELFFGDNTHWCTRGSETWFNKYSDEGYMICVPLENGRPNFKSSGRYQFHISDSCQFYCCNTADRKVGFDSMPTELQGVIKVETERKREQVKEKYRSFTEVVTRTIATQLGIEQVDSKKKNCLCFIIRDGLYAYFDESTLALTLCNGKHKKKIAGCNIDKSIYSRSNSCLNVEQEVAKYCNAIKPIIRLFSADFLGDYTLKSFDINGVKSFICLELEKGDKKVYVSSLFTNSDFVVSVKPFVKKKWSENLSVYNETYKEIETCSLSEFIDKNYETIVNINKIYDYVNEKANFLSSLPLFNYTKNVRTKKGNLVTINSILRLSNRYCYGNNLSLDMSFNIYADNHSSSSMYSVRYNADKLDISKDNCKFEDVKSIIDNYIDSFVRKASAFYSLINYLYPNGFIGLKESEFFNALNPIFESAKIKPTNNSSIYYRSGVWHWANIRS